MLFTLCLANYQQNPKNVYYPHHRVISNADMLKEAVHYDHVGADFKDGYRNLKNFSWSDVSILDCDNDHSEDPSQWVTPDACNYLFPDVAFALVPSRHDQKEKGNKPARPRFHLYFPHKKFKTPEEETELKKRIQERYPFFDKNAVDGARFLFGCDPAYVIWHPGAMTIDEYLEKYHNPILAAMEAPEEPLLLPAAESPAATASPVPFGATLSQQVVQEQKISPATIIPEGTRNSTLSQKAAKLVKRYGVTEKAKEKFLKEASRCVPPLPAKELESIWKSAEKFGVKVASQEGYIPPELYGKALPTLSLCPLDFSDMGQARVFCQMYSASLVYTDATNFLVYNGVYWQESRQMAVGLMQQLVDRQLEEARMALETVEKVMKDLGCKNGDWKKRQASTSGGAAGRWQQVWKQAKAYEAFVIKRRDRHAVEGAMAMAAPMVLQDIEKFDNQEFLLNTPCGTYDLRQGMHGYMVHRADNFLTKVTTVSPGSRKEALWQQCLETFFQGDQDLITYVQHMVGLAAIGKVYQESLIIAYGSGSNGKSTFWNAIARVLGSYSGTISSDVLTVGCRRNTKPEMAELKGKRLVIASELEEGTRLNTAFMKQLCSTDEITAEKKYKDPFRFVPTHTLVLCTNHLPKVGANDKGTWRRLILIPFEAKLEGNPCVKNYTEYLVNEAGGAILKWIIEGAQKVIAADFSIPVPHVVAEAVEIYKENNDWLGRFLEDCCDQDPSYVVKVGDLYAEYQSYSFHQGEYTRNRTDFAQALSLAGFPRSRTGKARFVKGIKVKISSQWPVARD